MATTYEALAPSIARVQALAMQLTVSSADAGFTPEVAATLQGAARTFQAAVDSWAVKQAQEVVNGSRTLENWLAYGKLLEQQAHAKQQDVEEQSGWFGRVVSWIADKVTAGVDAISAKVAAIRADVNAVGPIRARVAVTREQLRPVAGRLSDESRDTLFGSPWEAAEATWTKVTGLVDALEAMVAMVRGGKAQFQAADGGDVRVVPLHGAAYSLVGALPALAAGTVLATIAVAAALAAAVVSYYRHADEVVRAELERQENEMVASGKLTVAQVQQLRAQRQAGEPPTVAETLAKAGAAVAVTSVGLWGAYKLGAHLLDRLFERGGRK